ncbi:MAG TPA: serine/threonine-protein kinase, partial [Gammaproteobacteria bacterium]|nr:serine/threonine-protein kinase [Gammaproteobacteria bacterium]
MAENTHRNSLKTGHKIGPYEIIAVLGHGGFGITYLAKDINLNREVAIKEYLPVELAVRDTNTSIYPVSGEHGEQFTWGLERFVNEAQTLARFKHPNIVRVLTILRENNTAYIVMEYEHGQPLHELIKGRKTLGENELKNILIPILDGLEAVHNAGFIHRDIKPANIYIRADNSPVLIDFGSARQSLFEYTRTLTTMVSPGYAPFEQYVGKSDKQGPWTDIYGLGATLYRAVTGISPQDSIDRSESILHTGKDIYVSAAEIAGDKYSSAFLAAIDKAMAFKTDERPQTIAEWRKMLDGDIPVSSSRTVDNKTTIIETGEATEKIKTGADKARDRHGVFTRLFDWLYGLTKKIIKWGLLVLAVMIVAGILKNI